MPDIRELTAADRSALSSFTCARDDEPWAYDVQMGIRNDLADWLTIASPDYGALGRWEADALVGVVTWSFDQVSRNAWWVSVLAVHVDHRGVGHAVALKTEVLIRAQAAGMEFVYSRVDKRNEPMRCLNKRRFGAIDKTYWNDASQWLMTIRL